MTSGHLRTKGGKYYAVMSWYGDDKKRHYQWVGLEIEDAHNARKAEARLKEVEKVFNPKNVGKTNAALLALGLKEVKMDQAENGYVDKGDGHSEYGMTPHMLFGTFVEWWVSEARPTIALSTYSGYYYQANRVIGPWFDSKGIRLESVSAEDIQAFYREEEKKVSPNTIRHFHALIRKGLDHAYRNDVIAHNPCDKVTLPKMERFIGGYYNVDEVQRLFKEAEGNKLEFAILMAAHYGLRREEIIGLKWSAIDFQYKQIHIRHTVTEYVIDGKPKLIARDAAKTSSSVRTLPLLPSIEEFLLKMKAKREDWQKFYGNRYHHEDDDYVYVNEDGTLVHPNYISRYFPKFLKTKGLRKIRFHDLRHTCATLLRHEGVPMEDIQKWLGHSEISTTERIYAHFDDRSNLPTSDKIAEAFGEEKVAQSDGQPEGATRNGKDSSEMS
jgi:integrase